MTKKKTNGKKTRSRKTSTPKPKVEAKIEDNEILLTEPVEAEPEKEAPEKSDRDPFLALLDRVSEASNPNGAPVEYEFAIEEFKSMPHIWKAAIPKTPNGAVVFLAHPENEGGLPKPVGAILKFPYWKDLKQNINKQR